MNSSQKILCVLPDQDDINLFIYFLAPHGFKVQGVTSIEEGLRICLTDPPDLLIVLRIVEKVEDGLLMCQQLRGTSAELSTMPIIMGWADMFHPGEDKSWETAYQTAFDAGVNACFGRVFSTTDVLEQVKLLMADRTLTHLADRQKIKMRSDH